MLKLTLYMGLETIPFETSEQNIKNLHRIYYGWEIDAPWRKQLPNPIQLTGNVVLNGLRRNYLESLWPKNYIDLLRRKENKKQSYLIA